MATFGPTSVILVPETRMIWLVRRRPASGSSNRPARIAVTGPGDGGCAASGATDSATVRSARRLFSMAVKLPGGAGFCKRRLRGVRSGRQRRDDRLRLFNPHCGGRGREARGPAALDSSEGPNGTDEVPQLLGGIPPATT